MSTIIFIIILFVLVVSHEFGHFIVAKKAGIRVDEFGFGFPPRLLKFKKGETLYSLNAIPLGGFVKILGENPDEDPVDPKDKNRMLSSKPRYIQAAVISAGVVFNLILAWILISASFMIGTLSSLDNVPASASVSNPFVLITSTLENSPASDAGLKSGDKIVAVLSDKESIQDGKVKDVQNFISSHGDEPIYLLYKRGDDTMTAFVTPKNGIVSDKPAIGVGMADVGTVRLSPFDSLKEGMFRTVYLTKQTAVALYDLTIQAIRGKADLSSLAGPVGIVGLVGDAKGFGFTYLLAFTALISINLAVFNLLPIPALDGGRLLVIIIEAIKRTPVKPMTLNIANSIGFILIIALAIFVTYNDIVKLVVG